jgi:hypothetical protein
MKVLLTALHFANYRNFESVIRSLAARGHDVHLLADERETFGGQAFVERLAAEYPNVSFGLTPSPVDEPWFPLAQKLRFALDYVRFLDSRYAAAEKLRLRNIERTPRIIKWITSGVGGAVVGHRRTAALLKAIERRLPPSRAITAVFEAQQPDVVLLTSLTFSRSFAMEQMKAARSLGVPTAACIMSWDHLSSKALVHIQPDVTIVWNDVQKHEAIEMHGIPASRIIVTGAQCYDQWFDKQPERSRQQFCRAVGLDPERPFVLYVCSAMSPVPDPAEPAFVKEWIQALRSSSDPALRTAGVLVRPHPERVKEWAGISLDGLENVAVGGRNPIDADAKADYFDSIYYSRAVVGLCTTAFLEAAIIGRPVLTMQLPAYRMHQDGMAHFRYLLNVEGGLLHTAPDVGSHLSHLAGVMKSDGSREERNRRFLTAFVRPGGLESPSTPRFVEAVEALARPAGHAQTESTFNDVPLVLRAAIAASNTAAGRWLLMDAIDIARQNSERANRAQKEQILGTRAAYREREHREREAIIRATRQERAAKEWRKWRRGLSARKQVARLKASVKRLIEVGHH